MFSYNLTDSEEDKLSWMEVINAAAESPLATAEKYAKRRNSIRKRMTRRVSDNADYYLNKK